MAWREAGWQEDGVISSGYRGGRQGEAAMPLGAESAGSCRDEVKLGPVDVLGALTGHVGPLGTPSLPSGGSLTFNSTWFYS